MSKYVSLIPLRGGSKSIPLKNIKTIAGHPLCSFVIRASLKAGLKTYVSTDSLDIANVVTKHFPSVKVVNRPAELALDSSTTEECISHFLNQYPHIENIVLLQATSPFTTEHNILEALNLHNSEQEKSLISAVKNHSFRWDIAGKPINYDPKKRPMRQDWEGEYIENGAIYIFSKQGFLAHSSRCWQGSLIYEMSPKTLFEIDEPSDWQLLEEMLSMSRIRS